MKKIKKIIIYLTYFIQIFFINYLLTIIKKNKERIQKEELQKEACEGYQNLSEEEKEKKYQDHRDHNKNLSEEQKNKSNSKLII